jgi:hypothetical protein
MPRLVPIGFLSDEALSESPEPFSLQDGLADKPTMGSFSHNLH